MGRHDEGRSQLIHYLRRNGVSTRDIARLIGIPRQAVDREAPTKPLSPKAYLVYIRKSALEFVDGDEDVDKNHDL